MANYIKKALRAVCPRSIKFTQTGDRVGNFYVQRIETGEIKPTATVSVKRGKDFDKVVTSNIVILAVVGVN